MKMQHLESDEDGHGLLNNSWEGNTVIISCSLAWVTTSSVISAHPLQDLYFLTWIKVVPGGFLPHIRPLEASGGGGPRDFVATPRQHPQRMPNWNSNEQWEKYIGTQAAHGNQSWQQKSVRVLIERTCLREIKSGGVTVLSYQDLMVASQDKCTSLN